MIEEGALNKIGEEKLQKSKKPIFKRPRRKIVNSQSSETERELYYPDLYEYKKLDLAIENKRVERGSWSQMENKIYLRFLYRNKKDFVSQEIRRKTVVFNRLSKQLQKRTPDQCRSHHQKLQNRFDNNIETIIDFVLKKIKKRDPSFQMQRFLKEQKDLRPTRTGETSDNQEGVVIDMEELLIW